MSKTDQPWLWIAILAFGSAPLSSPAKAQPSKAAREISRLENLYSQSFVTGDERTPERLLADDFIGFGSTGKPSDKTAMLSEVRSLPHQASAKITSISVRVHGDTAIALGTEDDFNSSRNVGFSSPLAGYMDANRKGVALGRIGGDSTRVLTRRCLRRSKRTFPTSDMGRPLPWPAPPSGAPCLSERFSNCVRF